VSTLHTPDAVTTVNRIVAMFPPEQEEVARLRLSETPHAVISQRLLPRADGHGRAAALEIMICTDIVRDLIKEKERTFELPDYIGDSREKYGMQTIDQHLLDLVSEGVVTYETALPAASNPKEFELQMRSVRRRSRGAKPAEVAPVEPDKPVDDLSSLLPPS
jgi:twitching motility protein PilT